MDFLGAYQNLINVVLLNSILALSVYITFAVGMFSLANAAFVAIGAYSSSLLALRLGQPMWVGIATAVAASVVVALIVGLPVVRLKGIYLALATTAFGECVRIVALNADDITGGIQGLSNIPRYTQTWHLVLFLAVLVVLFALARGSRFGRAMDAVRQDDTAAAAMGINVVLYKNTAFVLSSVICGIGGVLSAHMHYAITPAQFDFWLTTSLLVYVVLGGINHWSGAIVGATVFTLLPEVLRPLAQYRQIAYGMALVLVMLFMPRGLIDPRRKVPGWSRLSRLLRLGPAVTGGPAPAGPALASDGSTVDDRGWSP